MARVMCAGRAMKTFENGLPLAGFRTGVIAAGSTSIICPLIYGVVIIASKSCSLGSSAYHMAPITNLGRDTAEISRLVDTALAGVTRHLWIRTEWTRAHNPIV